MRVYELIKQLIDLVGEFVNERKSNDIHLKSFVNWVSKRMDQTSASENYTITGHSREAEIAAHIGRLSRYSNTYIKSALVDLPFTTDMDFAFTAILHRSGEIGKTDLIRKMVYDKSSGMEVIKRLLKNEIIEQFPNPDDKRSKLLRLTKKGEEYVIMAYGEASKAAKVVSGCLTENEQISLLNTLKKLDDFHLPIYLEEEKDLEIIREKYFL
ncbi:MarR family transcriptional regulator [Aquimarina sp. BL5]|uniref:MarR family winged helix-turn-helix transcriptional regulator n=1 Tax=Aquimarina sp. BL5 TaxID=1714860 RepID=UPI000E52325F|nr:MarR family transcriptional regulator [Aquimarina sp. BL5]AXT52193.1 MarR family transcriptional regulator [Aquimarina sp. BL5]RKN07696.1 MarR family transcriptional regulator [Aquimarina sp. BL5]